MEEIEREHRRNRKFKKYTAVSIIILSVFVFYLSASGFMIELTGGYQSLLFNWLGKTNKWSGSYGPQSLVDTLSDITALSSEIFISLFSVVFGGYLFLRRKYRTLYTYFFVVVGAGLFHVFLKNYLTGEKWYNWFNFFIIEGKVFPSGHAFMSVVFYFTLARLTYRANPDHKINRYLMTIALLLSILIGISLIIKGAHSPNDVIGGWSIGIAWISAAWLIDHLIRKKIYLHHHNHPEETD